MNFGTFIDRRLDFKDERQKELIVKAIRILADRIEDMDIEFFHDDPIGMELNGVVDDILSLEAEDFFGTEGMQL